MTEQNETDSPPEEPPTATEPDADESSVSHADDDASVSHTENNSSASRVDDESSASQVDNDASVSRADGDDPNAEASVAESNALEQHTEDQDVAALLATLANDHAIDTSAQDRQEFETASVSAALLEQVEESSETALAQTLAVVAERLSQVDAERVAHAERAEELESRLRRKQAEFQNYKKRQQTQLEAEKKRATEDLVGRLLDVRDNLQRALDQDEGVDIRGGIEATLSQFDSQLERENVEPINPEPGDEVDPARHEVLATVASDQPENQIAERYRPGYEMAGKVIRTAQVTVSDGSEHDDATDTESDK